MNVVPFRSEHMAAMGAAATLTASQIAGLVQAQSWTALDDGGEAVACAGVVKLWPGRYAAWAVLSPERSGPYMRQVTKATRAFIEALDAARVELTVREGNEAGHQWARILGFELETAEMPRYGADGAAHAMYVRIKR